VAKAFEPAKIVSSLSRYRVDYVLIGGFAAIARLAPYMTTDIDICPSQDDHNLERLAEALVALKAKRATDLEPEGVEVTITVDYLSRENELAFVTNYGQLDVIFVPRGTRGHQDLKRESSLEEVFGSQVWVPSTLDVIRMKDARGLPKDRLVVDVLRKVLDREGPEA
jgi:hypothetical protein